MCALKATYEFLKVSKTNVNQDIPKIFNIKYYLNNNDWHNNNDNNIQVLDQLEELDILSMGDGLAEGLVELFSTSTCQLLLKETSDSGLAESDRDLDALRSDRFSGLDAIYDEESNRDRRIPIQKVKSTNDGKLICGCGDNSLIS